MERWGMVADGHDGWEIWDDSERLAVGGGMVAEWHIGWVAEIGLDSERYEMILRGLGVLILDRHTLEIVELLSRQVMLFAQCCE